jgi:MFS transporter, DHA2 family, multidrug resistance protein
VNSTLAEPLRRQRPRAAPSFARPETQPVAVPTTAAQTHPTLRDWVGILAMVFGLFMAIMDVQIVASSLTQIQGGLSASPDEISWVQTAYLIADVVMVPLSGTLSRLLSTRVLFVSATIGFTAASALCATATSLSQMILYRALQGFSGGAITPTVFPVIYTKFRGPQLATLMVLISVILNLSSTLGPTVGGFLTDALSWHWLFLRNRGCRCRMVANRYRPARSVVAAVFRHLRARIDGVVPRLPRICARRRPALGLAKR